MTPAAKPTKAAASAGLPAELPSVIVLAGDEDRKKDILLEEILKRVGPDAAVVQWNSDPVDRPEVELSKLLCDLRSRPLFGPRRVIVARDGDGLFKRLGKGLQGTLQSSCGNLLILLMRALDQRTTFAKQVKKEKGLFVCTRPKVEVDANGMAAASGELVGAVLDEAKRHGLTLPPNAARELAARTGNDLMMVNSELEKLSLFTHQKEGVTLADVEAVVPRSATWDQFQLFQDVATGSLDKALTRLRGMLREGTTDRSGKRVNDPRAIGMTVLYMLHNKVRLLARYRELQRDRVDKEGMLAALGIRNPGQLFYLGKEASLPLVSAADFAIDALVEADRDLKSSVPAVMVLERLIVRLARLARPGRGASAMGARR